MPDENTEHGRRTSADADELVRLAAHRRPLVVYGIPKGGQRKEDPPGLRTARLTADYLSTRMSAPHLDLDSDGQPSWAPGRPGVDR
ncbi:hypothetical protein [Streptomyces nigrescens]|uniref:hypothetical protein n=1 Tax=Streptomyces nigrescens TaxID=1920 RepID=UPI0036FFB458